MRLLGVAGATVVLTALVAWLLILGWFVHATASVVDSVVIEPLREAGELAQAVDEMRALPFVDDADWEYVTSDSVSHEVVTVELADGATDIEVVRLWCDILLDLDARAEVYLDDHRQQRPKRADCPAPSPPPQVTGE